MKRYYLVAILLMLFALSSCGKDQDDKPTTDGTPKQKSDTGVDMRTPDNNVNAYAKKALTGSFVDFWSKGDWTKEQWSSFLGEMQGLHLNTVIVQFAAYGDYTWFDSKNTFTNTKFKGALGNLLTVAAEKGMEVYIGLYFDGGYWHNQTNVSWLHTHADRCIEIAREIQAQFGNSKAFKGWYIPHEPEPNAYNSSALVASFRDNFVNRISNRLHQLNNKPVAIAAFWNSDLSTPDQLQHFMAELSKCNLQVIMLQDGVGAKHVTLDRLAAYYQSAEKGLYTENTSYKGAFWIDLETFEQIPSGEFSSIPANFDRVKGQIAVAIAVPRVSKVVSFDFYSDMSSVSPKGERAKKLYKDYQGFISTIK